MGNQQSIHKDYLIKEKLGSGSFATVKKGIRKSDKEKFAIKEIKKGNLSDEELRVVEMEVTIMKSIDHPNCVKLYKMYDTPKKVYMVLELLTGGELFDRIVAKGNFSEKEAAGVIHSVTTALKYLHSLPVVHRDLKPENLLYASPDDDAAIKITDFGLAKSKNASKMSTACGTPGYVAPEVLKNLPYGPAVDMWSVGVVLYILLCGFPPFYHEETKKLYRMIKKGEFGFPAPYWTDISKEAKDLVQRLLTVQPDKRATPDDVLNHPWISSASDKAFGDDFGKRLKLLQAKKKLRNAVHTVLAMNRFKRALIRRTDQPPPAYAELPPSDS